MIFNQFTCRGCTIAKRFASNSGKSSGNQLGKLQNLLSNMKTRPKDHLSKFDKFGNSELFHYATCGKNKTNNQTSESWNKMLQRNPDRTASFIPQHGFDEMIKLTEEGRLWKFPIDNEQGLEEKQVPFEDHVFLEDLLEGFPKNEQIREFMQLVISGLAKNHWMTVERKHDIIKFYKEYFEDKKDSYRAAGFELQY